MDSAKKASELYKETDMSEYVKDILIFVPGNAEGEAVIRNLREYEFQNTKILYIDAKAVKENSIDNQLLLTDIKNGGQLPLKIIVATVVAETGLTIESLLHVIDAGWSKINEVYYPSFTRGLITKPAPKSRIIQRKGHCGRVVPGKFHPLYCEKTFEALPDQQFPDIITEGPKDCFLKILLSIQDKKRKKTERLIIDQIQLIDQPSEISLWSCISEMAHLGFINSRGKLTKLGLIAAHFTRMTPNMIRLLFAFIENQLSLCDCATICACLNTINTPKQLRGPSKIINTGDVMEILYVFDLMSYKLGTLQVNSFINWCNKNEFNKNVFYTIIKEREEFIGDIMKAEINVFQNYSQKFSLYPELYPKYMNAFMDAFPFGFLESRNNSVVLFGHVIPYSSDVLIPWPTIKPKFGTHLYRYVLTNTI